MTDFVLKRGDTSPALQVLVQPAGVVLAGATAVFNMRRAADLAPVVERAAVTIQESPPGLTYAWAPEDTATAGLFVAEFEVTYADGSVESFPNTRNLQIELVEDLG